MSAAVFAAGGHKQVQQVTSGPELMGKSSYSKHLMKCCKLYLLSSIASPVQPRHTKPERYYSAGKQARADQGHANTMLIAACSITVTSLLSAP